MEKGAKRLARLAPKNRYDGRLWSIPVLLLGLLATLVIWHAVRIHEHTEVHWVTKLAAESIKTDLVTDMEWQLVGLDRLAMMWQAADPARDLWIKNAELYIQHRPGCLAVIWLDANRDKGVSIRASGSANKKPLASDGMPKALLDRVANAKVPMISTPESLPDGSKQWVLAYPVYEKEQLRGFIVSFFDFKVSLNYILDDVKGLGFSVAVMPPDQPEYLLPGSTREHEQDWGELIDVPLAGATWQLRIWPKPDVVNIIRSTLPDVALVTGSAISLLLALTMYFAFGAARSSALTRISNEALQREVSVREGAQEELRHAHLELETRIDQRTAELATANALLRREVTDHKHAEEMLEELTRRLFQLQDEERRRLARELHDGAVQNLIALAMNLGMIRDAVPTEDVSANELVNECVRLIEQSESELRTISYLLHPPYFDELGLTAALRDFADGFANRSGIEVTLEIDSQLGRLGYELELAIYRVVQEALSNVHRHSQSRTAKVALGRRSDLIQLVVADAGRGIPQEVLAAGGGKLAGVGLNGMRERVRLLGGRLEIQSNSAGTSIQAILPLPVLCSEEKKCVASSPESTRVRPPACVS